MSCARCRSDTDPVEGQCENDPPMPTLCIGPQTSCMTGRELNAAGKDDSSSCCSPLVVHVVGVMLAMVATSLFRLFLYSMFSHYVLYHQSPTPNFCCCSLFSSHSFQISLTQSSLSTLGLLRLLLPSTFWASHLFATFSSPILST